MSEILDCDPDKGFVAFPVALFDLDLTPGAFRTLAELCRMANTAGQCWPSLAQLGRRLGRSRAAVSGYIAELRATGVLTTEEQKMANGYNYRLRYTVTFWAAWRAGLGRTAPEKPTTAVVRDERRVQPAERPLRTKNHIHSNQESGFHQDLLEKWKRCAGNAPYPGFAQTPTACLRARTEHLSAALPAATPVISADITAALGAFAHRHGLQGSVKEATATLVPLVKSRDHLDALIKAVEDQWQPHWRKPPSDAQWRRALSTLPPVQTPQAVAKLLKSYLRRWKLYARSLPSPQIHSTVAA